MPVQTIPVARRFKNRRSRADARAVDLRHHGPVTDANPAQLPPDPVQYDAPRNVSARRRGLAQPYISGGDDPELVETIRRERRYVRILVAMVVVIVLLGFVLGFAGAIISSPRA
jgi:hypothetical protein